MTGGLPNLRMHDDCRIEPNDVFPHAGHAFPPQFFHVALQFGAERAVIPEAIQAAVNLAGLEDEPPAFAEADDLFHA